MMKSDSLMRKFLNHRDPEQIAFRVLVLVCISLEYL